MVEITIKINQLPTVAIEGSVVNVHKETRNDSTENENRTAEIVIDILKNGLGGINRMSQEITDKKDELKKQESPEWVKEVISKIQKGEQL